MVQPQPTTPATRVYSTLVSVMGLMVICESIYAVWLRPVDPQWFLLAALTLISGAASVKLPAVPASISISEVFVFVAALLFGIPAATLIVALDALVLGLRFPPKIRLPGRVLFNVSTTSLSCWAGANVFFAWAGVQPLFRQDVQVPDLIPPLIAFAVVYFLLNSFLIATAIALAEHRNVYRVWRGNFLWLSLNYFGGASVAALLVSYTKDLDVTHVAVIVPLLLVLYFTFAASMGRVADANRHLEQLSRLYMSTIETLATAIDAKDQITHGHIRRVQLYAVGLARKLGVTEDKQIRAIEAASLLHDMGKLAVPDYILNKPGPLTPAEYEKMKLHASVGGDILSSIEFPYPVVPIVRHHHESWDGTGYPDGIRGSDIPIGARILSVVDCFDALTSDRPYRPKLSDAAALDIILKRRGKMYDPFVVDMFVKVHKEFERHESRPSPVPLYGLSAITEAAQPPGSASNASSARLDEIAASSEEMLTLFEISRSLTGTVNIDDAAGVIARHLRRVVPSTFCVFYVYDATADELVVAHAAGDTTGIFTGLRIPLGQRLTGWVAANRQTIVNSDPMLDLGETARALQPPLRSSIATPLLTADNLVGVLSLYSSSRNAFTDDHRRIIEAVARQVSNVIRSARDFERDKGPALRDTLTGLPNIDRLRQFAASLTNAEGRLEGSCSVLFIDVDGLKDVNRELGRAAGDRILAGIVEATRRTLRGADLLFRYRSDEFVVYLAQTDPPTAAAIASRVQAAIRESELVDRSRGIEISVSTGISSSPEDTRLFDDLVAQAKQRAVGGRTDVNADGPRGSVH